MKVKVTKQRQFGNYLKFPEGLNLVKVGAKYYHLGNTVVQFQKN